MECLATLASCSSAVYNAIFSRPSAYRPVGLSQLRETAALSDLLRDLHHQTNESARMFQVATR